VFSAPFDVVFSQRAPQVVVPDLVFVSKERSSLIPGKNIQGVPDLIVEILSEATATRDRRQKLSLCERFGLPEYGIVDSETETVQVFRLVKKKSPDPLEFRKEEPLTTPLLPGLSLSLRGVYRRRAETEGEKAHPVEQTLAGVPAFFGAVPGRFSFGLLLREMEA
jgi:Uma2 family endonuclease